MRTSKPTFSSSGTTAFRYSILLFAMYKIVSEHGEEVERGTSTNAAWIVERLRRYERQHPTVLFCLHTDIRAAVDIVDAEDIQIGK